MRLARDSSRVVASILAIGILAVVLTVACPEGVHVTFTRALGSACAAMPHAGGVAAAVASEPARAVTPVVTAVAAAFAPVLISSFEVASLAPLAVSPGVPTDPLHGRLRL